jgi:6-phosphogluconolactonase
MKLLQADSPESLADCAAKITIDYLNSAIHEFDEAVWILPGGNTPLLSYEVIVSKYLDAVDWQKVWIAVGDERQVETNDAQSNWGSTQEFLLSKLNVNQDKLIKPEYFADLSMMADSYAAALDKLPKAGNGLPRLDVVWLGLGEDGHTLSLFPGSAREPEELVETVTDSPKPPSARISLTLKALKQVRRCLVLAYGSSKSMAVEGLIEEDMLLPIVQAVRAIEDGQGQVCLLTDKATHPNP